MTVRSGRQSPTTVHPLAITLPWPMTYTGSIVLFGAHNGDRVLGIRGGGTGTFGCKCDAKPLPDRN